ncbi:hypothetical protein [Streptodolium elevatio]|uniref:Hydrophobic protein n=1 Tax=Streptodolium elevatio TaxID=3157996 RepID=A0ABV3DMP7_9ACTN
MWFLVLIVVVAVVLFLFGIITPLLCVVAIGFLVAWILGTFRRARYGRPRHDRDRHDDYHRHGGRRRY